MTDVAAAPSLRSDWLRSTEVCIAGGRKAGGTHFAEMESPNERARRWPSREDRDANARRPLAGSVSAAPAARLEPSPARGLAQTLRWRQDRFQDGGYPELARPDPVRECHHVPIRMSAHRATHREN
jgi:hypothetical protein